MYVYKTNDTNFEDGRVQTRRTFADDRNNSVNSRPTIASALRKTPNNIVKVFLASSKGTSLRVGCTQMPMSFILLPVLPRGMLTSVILQQCDNILRNVSATKMPLKTRGRNSRKPLPRVASTFLSYPFVLM